MCTLLPAPFFVAGTNDTSKHFRFEVQTCSWKTVIGASCPPAPQSYRCHVILTEPRGSANQIMRTQANSTYRTTRGQTFNSLCLPSDTRRSGELTPLCTSTLLHNNLSSELRSPNISFSLFHCTIMKYLGHPVRRP